MPALSQPQNSSAKPNQKEASNALKAALDRATNALSSAISNTPTIALTDQQRAEGVKAAKVYIESNPAVLPVNTRNASSKKPIPSRFLKMDKFDF
jgi:hypothetical protein